MSAWTIAFIAAGVIVASSSVVCAWALCRIAARADERMENIRRNEGKHH